MSTAFIDQDNEFDRNKLTNLVNNTVVRNPTTDSELSNKIYVDDSIGEGSFLSFNQSLQNYLKIGIGNTDYNLTDFDRFQIC